MSRYVIAAVLAIIFTSQADAQYVATPIPGAGYYSPGGRVVGGGYYYTPNGVPARYFTYDTGEYALAGFGGVARYQGYFVMQPGAVPPSPYAEDASVGHNGWSLRSRCGSCRPR